MTKGLILPFLKKGDIEIAKNYCGISLPLCSRVTISQLLNCIEPEIEKILRKN